MVNCEHRGLYHQSAKYIFVGMLVFLAHVRGDVECLVSVETHFWIHGSS